GGLQDDLGPDLCGDGAVQRAAQRGRQQDVAFGGEHLLAAAGDAPVEALHAPGALDVLAERRNVQTVRVADRAAGVTLRDDAGAVFGEQTRRVAPAVPQA